MDANALKLLEGMGIPILFLDMKLNISGFTSAIKQVYSILPSDIGRPIDDLRSLANDEVTPDALQVLADGASINREIKTRLGQEFTRRVSAVGSTAGETQIGVMAIYLDRAVQTSGVATPSFPGSVGCGLNPSATNFLLEACHDLRQPLQAVTLIQALLRKSAENGHQIMLLDRLDRVVATLTATIGRLVETNRLEGRGIQSESSKVMVNNILNSVSRDVSIACADKATSLRIVSSSISVISNQRLLHELLRNATLHAIEGARGGRLLIGVRSRHGMAAIEIWSTGRNTTDQSPGLAVVRRLAGFLGHRISWESRGKTLSVFSVELPGAGIDEGRVGNITADPRAGTLPHGAGVVIVIEQDQDVRALLEIALTEERYEVHAVSSVTEAAVWLGNTDYVQRLVVADYHTVKESFPDSALNELGNERWSNISVILLTGDIPIGEQVGIDRLGLIQVKKPVRLSELCEIIHRLMPTPLTIVEQRNVAQGAGPTALPEVSTTICVVDDDEVVRDAIGVVFEDAGYPVRRYADGETFLASMRPDQKLCLLIDAYLPGISGLEVLERFRYLNPNGAAIMITGSSDVSMAVRAMKSGAADFIEKPAYPEELLDTVGRAILQPRRANAPSADRAVTASIMARLTRREQEIMRKVLEGQASKKIAFDLGISKRTVENHRAAIMKKTGSTSLPALARLGFGL